MNKNRLLLSPSFLLFLSLDPFFCVITNLSTCSRLIKFIGKEIYLQIWIIELFLASILMVPFHISSEDIINFTYVCFENTKKRDLERRKKYFHFHLFIFLIIYLHLNSISNACIWEYSLDSYFLKVSIELFFFR